MKKTAACYVTAVLVFVVLGSMVLAKSLEARAELRNAGGQKVGTASFKEVAGGVRIQIKVQNLPPGPHGMHIHMVGKCDGPEFTTAGAHFNPGAKKHGAHNPSGPHAGDMSNLIVNARGKAEMTLLNAGVTLKEGPNSLMDADGSALVIHAAADDEKTDPTGNSGARIACGVITFPGKR